LLFGRRLRRPWLLHLLWLAVLVKLLLPPLWTFGVLPAVAVSPPELASESNPSSVFEVPVEAVAGTSLENVVLSTLLWVWGLGTVAFVTLCTTRLRRLRQSLGPAGPVPTDLQTRVQELAAMLGLTRIPRISMTEARISPLVWSSVGGSRLVLPTRLFEILSPDQRDTILVHELAHLERGDDRLRWLELAALAVYWWNPIAWIASRQLREAEEACCDAMVARALPDLVSEYARGLAETVRHLAQPTPRLVPVSGLGAGGSLERRISMLFTVDSVRIPSPRTRVLAITAVLVMLGISPMLTALELPEVAPQVAPPEFVGDPITFTLRDADVREVLETFAEIGGLEMVIAPDVAGLVTMQMEKVPWDQGLYSVLQANGLTYETKDGVVHVLTGGNLPAIQERAKLEGELDGDSVYRAGPGGVVPPRFLQGTAVDYPEEARQGGINGTVVMDCLVDVAGTVRDCQVSSSNADVLTKAALEAVGSFTFEPATLDGVPVPARHRIPIQFKDL
jgi:TonB family protein